MNRYFLRIGKIRKCNPLKRGGPYPRPVRWLVQIKLEDRHFDSAQRHRNYSLKEDRIACAHCEREWRRMRLQQRKVKRPNLALDRAAYREFPF